MRTLIEEPGSSRFRISQEDLPVVEDQLDRIENLMDHVTIKDHMVVIDGLAHDDGSETFKYEVEYNHFKITQYSNDVVTLVMNVDDSLYYEDDRKVGGAEASSGVADDTCIDGMRSRAEKRHGYDVFRDVDESLAGELFGGVKQAIGMGYFYPTTDHLFGIPERESGLELQNTPVDQPYQLFATDQPNHMPGNPQPLYGSVPFVQGLSIDKSQAVTWINSAHTWVEIDDHTYNGDDGKFVSFVSESGAIEFFVLASTTSDSSGFNRVKKVQTDLATVSGFAPMPMIQTLGFHFCKWADVSAEWMIERNFNFTHYGFPVDVLWMDIEWAD